ncbi:hypothetical protein HN018_23135 (plasmid) [Lichenicola cladoniae]|uniref:Uncharacterized protein n=1 Tax=Lichenicola cladoniae TaxID=1484109 RepID=A0A6M8HXH9_9PROT|nr:hypothetical protein [Lichenicola cladoniae]NPD70268.1 hypothetical protein [Acetobacteraceae bacterium]QKE93092.1 hypothetical protein HN018_23135 [Lichenicola cladoniae]
MLKMSRRGTVEVVRELSVPEDQALRRAFGRYAEPEDRAAGAAVIQRYQRVGAGCWFLCDCLGPEVVPPALVPVSEAHIRRHYDPPWPRHDLECEFHRDAAEQRAITRSYVRLPEGKAVSLLAGLGSDDGERAPRLKSRSYGRRRGALATLLMHLIETASLNRVAASGVVAPVSEQYKALRAATAGIELDKGVQLSRCLCTYLPALPEFMDRIAQMPPGRFPKSGRPHGILIVVVEDASVGVLKPLRGDPVAVRGQIAVFGEREGHSRQSVEDRRARSPYLAICVVGRPSPRSPVEVLKAYLHPCMSAGHLMPVDSNLERHTFQVLVQLRTWLFHKKGIGLSIVKPLFDMSARTGLTESESDGDTPHEPCIPDFLLEADRVPKGGRSLLVIETMGYADVQYRDRKQFSHARMGLVTGQSPVVEHDFHYPLNRSQIERDRHFWLDCRWHITGSTERHRVPGAP